MYEFSNENSQDFNTFFECSIQRARMHEKVVVDMTMMSLKSRRKMLSKFPEFNFSCKVVMTDLNVIMKREDIRAQSGKKIPSCVYKIMTEQFIMPVLDEGFSDIELII